MDLTYAALIIISILIILSILVGLKKKKDVEEIDKGADDFNRVVECEIALRSIAYDTKSISSARKIAKDVLTDE